MELVTEKQRDKKNHIIKKEWERNFQKYIRQDKEYGLKETETK